MSKVKIVKTGPALFGDINQISEYVKRIKANEDGYTIDSLVEGLVNTDEHGYYLKNKAIKKKSKFVKIPKKTFKQIVKFLNSELIHNMNMKEEVQNKLSKIGK